ncbi:MAG: hypothetical protein ACT4QF_20645 [Sporichthyaceae bacterium]
MTEAGRQYLEMVEPGNAMLTRLRKLVDADSRDVDAVKAVCSDISEEWFTVVGRLQKGRWPSQVQDEVDDFAKEIAGERTNYKGCADAPDLDEIVDSLNGLADSDSNAASVLLRSALELPAAR